MTNISNRLKKISYMGLNIACLDSLYADKINFLKKLNQALEGFFLLMKKILIIIFLFTISLVVMASPINSAITLNKYQRYSEWCLNHNIDIHTSCPDGWVTYSPDQSSTIMFYVKHNILNSSRPSDPVHLNCNSVPVIVNPGSGFVCTVPIGGYARWEIEPIYLHNGADGVIFYAEGFHSEVFSPEL